MKNIFVNNSSSRRIKELDFLRGGVMLFVFLQHCGAPLSQYILTFHMPLFFVLSGYLIYYHDNISKQSFKFYFKKNIRRILLPYILFEIFILLISFFIGKQISITSAIKSIIMCINMAEYDSVVSRLWFLPCIFFCNLMMFFIVKYCHQHNKLLNLIFFLFGYVIYRFIPMRLPFTLDIAFVGTSFMLLGYNFQNYFKNMILGKLSYKKILLMLLNFGIMIFFAKINSNYFYMYINEYGNYLYAMIAAIAGCIAAIIWIRCIYEILIKVKITILIDYIIWIGKNTLFLFPIHLIIINLVKYILLLLNLNYWWLLFCILCLIVIPIIKFLNQSKFFLKLK